PTSHCGNQLLCSICLEVFTDPVTTPCGHNFCYMCIIQHWNSKAICDCPLCKKQFRTRPELYINTSFSGVVLRKTEAEMQQMIQERRVKIKEIRECVKRSKAAADREKLEETLSKEMKKLFKTEKKKLFEADLKRKQQFAVDVTLDPVTAHPDLILSDDGKQVSDGDMRKDLPNNPERFSVSVNVLGKQSFSSGKFYFEVQVKGKTKWNLGVSKESINRKGEITMSPDEGFWTIKLRNGNACFACENHTDVDLSLKSVPEKVGVFVDYEEGLVSFYDVNAAALIYSYTGCCFTDKLLPFFGPCLNDGGKNSAPLIICPVNQTA
uniref:B30.2/SPRY domain-containing protein n=1 Tax=Salarias fasciatus TaxID=181472 RepID=A0A672H9J7_SALFA